MSWHHFVNLIQQELETGIGFIGVGPILRTRGLTTGLTSAATLFLVASVGMAAGCGLYLTAMFATVMVLLSLLLLGHIEESLNVKLLATSYEATDNVDEISNEVTRILESHHRRMQNVAIGNTGRHIRLQFDVEGRSREQKQLLEQRKASAVLESAVCLGRVERP